MAFQRIDDNFDKLVVSVLGNLDPEFPKINKKELYQVATIDFLQKWFEIKKERDDFTQRQMLKRYSEKIQTIMEILIKNGWMPDKKRKRKK